MARPKKNVEIKEEKRGRKPKDNSVEERLTKLESQVKDLHMDMNTICDEINKLCNGLTDYFKEDVCDCEEEKKDEWKDFVKLFNDKKPKKIEVHINSLPSRYGKVEKEIDELIHNLFRPF